MICFYCERYIKDGNRRGCCSLTNELMFDDSPGCEKFMERLDWFDKLLIKAWELLKKLFHA